MNIKEIITSLIEEALVKMDITVESVPLDHPAEISHGDYSTNVAFTLAKAAKSNPVALAETIASEIPKHEMIDSVSAAAGFINFKLAPKFFATAVARILAQTSDFGKSEIHSGKKILVEHSSPNLFKPFHVGHVMNNAIGESVARLAQFSGATVIKMSYPSDVSLGIGKSVWALLEHGTAELEALPTLGEKLSFLGRCYVEGTKAFEENPSLERRVREITEMIYEKTPGVEYDAYLMGKDITLQYFLDITKRLGSEFDDFIYESEAGVVGKKLVLENLGKIFKESDNAVIYEGEKDGLHTRVFINAEGYPTYEAKDIGLLWMKFERHKPDISILVTDREQKSYYEVVLSAAGKIEKKWQENTIHKTHGRMSFMGKKMSSRLGGVPTAAEIMEVLYSEIADYKKDGIDYGVKEDFDAIAVSALKFTILKTMAGKDINFDPETSLSFEGDSGPYLQYTNARINSILEKAKSIDLEPNTEKVGEGMVTEVEKLLFRFPEVVELSITEWAPHHITTYLLQLARTFNSWYGNTKLVDGDNPDAAYNLAIAKSVGIVIQNGLQLLGIKSPDRM